MAALDSEAPTVSMEVELITSLDGEDLHDLCESTDMAILDGGGFGWVTPPSRETLEAYWKGVMAVPERELLVCRLNGKVYGSGQLVLPSRNSEAQRHAAHIQSAFVAPWARGHGLARQLTIALEAQARSHKFQMLNLDVRATQIAAIRLYEALGYVRWGSHPAYAWVKGKFVEGHYYFKNLRETELPKR